MNAVNLTMLKALRAAGVDEALAEEAASQILAAEHLATKADLAALENRLDSRISQVESRLDSRISQVENRLGSRISQIELRLVGWMLAVATLAIAVLTFLE